MGLFEDFLGTADGAIVRQFIIYGVGYEVARALIGPFVDQMAQDIASEHPIVPLSPADLADLVIKGYLTQDNAQTIARLSGVSVQNFGLMVDASGEPPATDFLLEAYRRGLINLDSPSENGPSLVQGINESRIKPEWLTLIDAMKTQILSAAEWVNAYLRGQVDLATAQRGAFQAGITNEDFLVMFNTAGNPPSPTELIELVRRGLIPLQGVGPNVTSMQQGIFEGDAKDKWEPLYEQLRIYIPPPRTVTALERAGAITTEQAQQLYQDAGLSPELAAAYSADASGQKLAPEKALAKTTVVDLYTARLIPEAQALTMLAELGYPGEEGQFIIELADLQRSLKVVNSAVTHIGALFIARKISASAAQGALGELQISADQIAELLATWTLEQRQTVKILTEGQIVDGVYYQVLTQAQAQAKLEALGYSAFDAWALISIRMHSAQPGPPPFDDEPAGNVA